VRILDTSDPTNLVFCAETGDFSSDKLIVNGNYLYASAYDMGLQIIDVSDTENPQWCGSIKPDNYNTISIAVSSNYVYMLDENFKQGGSETKLVAGPAPLGLYSATWMTLRVIDVSDPTDPYEVGRYRYYGYGWDLALSGDFIYIAAAEQGIIAVDISDPTEPRRVTSHRGASSAQRLAAGAQYLYVVSYDDNMRVIKLLESGGADESTTTTPVPVPHAWLDQYYDGLDNASAYESAALADQDNDGIPTWQEYVMDTDPNDDASFLRVTAIANEPSVVVVFDPASTVRDYTLLSTTNLLTGTWENVPGQGPRAGAGGADTMQDNRDIAPTRFYRIKVEVP
jgi:hypothetical protein